MKVAMGYLLSGRHMDARRAFEVGLVNEVVPYPRLDAAVDIRNDDGDGWVRGATVSLIRGTFDLR